MNEEIKEILDKIQKSNVLYGNLGLTERERILLLDYITNLQDRVHKIDVVNCKLRKENERIKEDNNRLRKVYKGTYEHLFKIGHDELARYFQAQINDCPTFNVETFDWYALCQDYKSKCEKANEISKHIINRINLLTKEQRKSLGALIYGIEADLDSISSILQRNR